MLSLLQAPSPIPRVGRYRYAPHLVMADRISSHLMKYCTRVFPPSDRTGLKNIVPLGTIENSLARGAALHSAAARGRVS